SLVGTGPQTLSGSGGELPNVVINSTGTVNLSGTITVLGDWTYTQGTVNADSSTVVFDAGIYTAQHVSSGTMHFNNVTVSQGNGRSEERRVGKVVDGAFTAGGSGATALNGGAIAAAGNVSATNPNMAGTATV